MTSPRPFLGAPRLFPALLLLAALALPGCGDNDPVTPGQPTNSTVSLFLNGGAYSNVRVDLLDKTRGASLKPSTPVTTAILDALGSFSNGEAKRVVLTLTIPAAGVGTFAWVDPKGAVLSSSGLFLSLYAADQTSETWQPVQGSTAVSSFGDVGGQIAGTFSGTLRNTLNGSIVNVSSGVFSITRTANQ